MSEARSRLEESSVRGTPPQDTFPQGLVGRGRYSTYDNTRLESAPADVRRCPAPTSTVIPARSTKQHNTRGPKAHSAAARPVARLVPSPPYHSRTIVRENLMSAGPAQGDACILSLIPPRPRSPEKCPSPCHAWDMCGPHHALL
eukprot:scaffold4624_cov138-Isochrysis_galbana.AAC.4